jgi:hypothetical protein
LTVGISVLFGGGSVGVGPVPEETSKVAISLQAASTRIAAPNNEAFNLDRNRSGAEFSPFIAVAPLLAVIPFSHYP